MNDRLGRVLSSTSSFTITFFSRNGNGSAENAGLQMWLVCLVHQPLTQPFVVTPYPKTHTHTYMQIIQVNRGQYPDQINWVFLLSGAFPKRLRQKKATTRLSVCLYERKSVTPTGWILVEFSRWDFH